MIQRVFEMDSLNKNIGKRSGNNQASLKNCKQNELEQGTSSESGQMTFEEKKLEDKHLVVALYKFTRIPEFEVSRVKRLLERSALDHGISGLVIIATEGCNMTIAGPKRNSQFHVDKFIDALSGLVDIKGASIKSSESSRSPYPRFKVVVRQEIVTLYSRLGIEGQEVNQHDTSHISPEKWNEMMAKECQVVDTRNDYEVQIGTFKGAINPKIDKFTEFKEFIVSGALDKTKPTLIFCTGGIRCEKAYGLMRDQGFKEVYQLDGGILNYFSRYPQGGEFEGECFVFDHRVAVDCQLQPTEKYKLSRVTGDPVLIEHEE